MKEQIEELQNDITECYGCDPMYYGTDGDFLAKGLVEMGWRKQEWISVEDIQKGNDINQSYFCSRDKMWCMPVRKADDFCSCGERKE